MYVTKILDTLFCLVREYSRNNNAVFKQALNSQKNSVIKRKITWAYNNNVIWNIPLILKLREIKENNYKVSKHLYATVFFLWIILIFETV